MFECAGAWGADLCDDAGILCTTSDHYAFLRLKYFIASTITSTLSSGKAL